MVIRAVDRNEPNLYLMEDQLICLSLPSVPPIFPVMFVHSDKNEAFSEPERPTSRYDPSRVGGVTMTPNEAVPSPMSSKNLGHSIVYNSKGKGNLKDMKKLYKMAHGANFEYYEHSQLLNCFVIRVYTSFYWQNAFLF